MFGDQTDVPESGDWWNAGYLIMWGSNLPVTRTPDAHWMTEARYRGQKVVAVAPDYADNVKFADEWLPARPGTDGALAMAMGHVVLKEFFVDRQTPYFTDYVEEVHRPALPGRASTRRGDGDVHAPGKFLTAADLPDARATRRTPHFKTVLIDARTGEPVVPNGSLGHRFGETGVGRWNLDLGDVDPRLSLLDTGRRDGARSELPRFDTADGAAGDLPRGVPVRRVGGHLVTTVFDLLLAQYGVGPRRACRASGRPAYDDADRAVHPGLAGGDHRRARRRPRPGSRREFAQNAEESKGRSMIVMGAGTNHWFHSDTIYRAFLDADHAHRLPGRQRRRLGALRRPGEGPPDHRLHPDRLRAGLEPAAAQHDPDRVLVPPHRPVPLRPRSAPTRCRRRPAAASSPARAPPT